MQIFEIPTQPAAQTFLVTLQGVEYRFTLTYKSAPHDGEEWGGWLLDLNRGGVRILSGIPLVTGADLFAQYRYLGLTGSLIVSTPGDESRRPTFEGLGTETRLYYVITP